MPIAQNAEGKPLWQLGAAEAAARFRDGRLSPVDVVESCLQRISALNDRVHAFIHVASEAARQSAQTAAAEIAAGRWRGPLHGIPFAVKDNYDAAGLPATAGSRLRLHRVSEHDAALVAKLTGEGAILLGKLSTWEYGTGNGAEYFDLPFPPARNPWDLARFSGGSSTGCGVAVACGMAMIALGSDTTGSVRIPAAATGTVGMVGGMGTLDRTGILPNCHTLDRPGVFAWTAEDAALAFAACRGRAMPADTSIAGLRVAVVRDIGSGFPPPDPILEQAFDAAVAVLGRLGARLVSTPLPVSAKECFSATRVIGPAESAAIHADDYREHGHAMGAALRDKLTAGAGITAVEYIDAQQRLASVRMALSALLSEFDALVTFGCLHTPPRLGVEPEMTAYTVDTVMTPFSLSGHPALVQCTGFTEGSLPLHWQIVSNTDAEHMLFRVAGAYEAATPWRRRRPEL